MVSMCLAIVGCTLISAAQPTQTPPGQDIEIAAYLQHDNENLRKRAVIILAAEVLAVRQPHSGDPEISPPQEMLFQMRASELPTLFDYLRDYWRKPLPNMRVHWSVMPASHYEQLHRFYRFLKKIKGIDSFPFESYIFPEEETITRLSLLGMTLVYNDLCKLKFEAYLKGGEPMKALAKDALEIAGIKTK